MHLTDVLLTGDGFRKMLVHLIQKLRTMLYHLVHATLLHKTTFTETILTVILILTTITIYTRHLYGKRHSTTLTKLLLHSNKLSYLYITWKKIIYFYLLGWNSNLHQALQLTIWDNYLRRTCCITSYLVLLITEHNTLFC